MKETNEFLMPGYFTRFACKMGACRSACCEGWPITVSMENYFRLLGIDCDKSLRDRLDVGLRMVDYPTPDCYARFNPRWDGNCPMRLEDGRCSVHASLGEDVLPDICRLYPRGIRSDAEKECSCANSCEAVLELLRHEKNPMLFERKILTVNIPETPQQHSLFDTLGRGQKIRMILIRFMQDRRHSLTERLLYLWYVCGEIARLLEEKNGEAIDNAAARMEGGDTILMTEKDFTEEEVLFGLDVIGQMLSILTRRHDSIRDYGEAALAYFGEESGRYQRYEQAKKHFDEQIRDWDIWFEQMIVNHMFFSRFPLQERPVSLQDEAAALIAVYAVLRYIGIAYMADKTDESDFVDAAAACFRMIDHTEFESYAAALLRRFGIENDADRRALLSI